MWVKSALSLVLIVAIFGAVVARASVPVSLFKQALVSGSIGPVLSTYMSGVGNGYVWANGELKARELPLLFCAPKMALTQDNFLQVLIKEIKEPTNQRKEWPDDTPIELVLLSALEPLFTLQVNRADLVAPNRTQVWLCYSINARIQKLQC